MNRDYISFNVRLGNELESIERLQIPKDAIDETIREKLKMLEGLCIDEHVDSSIITLVFGIDAMILDQASDAEILAVLRKEYKSEVASYYANTLLDRYVLEWLMRRGYQTLNAEFGAITSHMIMTSKDIQKLISKTPYFRYLKNTTLETLHKDMELYLYDTLQANRYSGVGIDGVVAKLLLSKLILHKKRVHARLEDKETGHQLERNYGI